MKECMTKLFDIDFQKAFIEAYINIYPDVTEDEAEYIYRISSYDYIKSIITEYTSDHYQKYSW